MGRSPIYLVLLSIILWIASCTGLQKVYQIEVEPRDKIAEEYYREALVKLKEKNISEALILLLRATHHNPHDSKIKRELNRLLSSLESEGNYRSEVIQKGSGLESPLQYILYYNTSRGKHPVSDIPVRFTFRVGRGILTENAITNDLGIAKCFIEKITDFDRVIIIEATIFLDIHQEETVFDHLTQDYVFRNISILDVPHSIVIYVDKVPDNCPPGLCDEALEPFHAQSFSDVRCCCIENKDLFQSAFSLDKSAVTLLNNDTQSDIIVLLMVKPSFVMRQSIDFYLYDALAEIKIIDTHTFLLQFEENTTERGAGRSSEESEYQVIVSAIRSLNKKVDEYLSRLRRRNGI